MNVLGTDMAATPMAFIVSLMRDGNQLWERINEKEYNYLTRVSVGLGLRRLEREVSKSVSAPPLPALAKTTQFGLNLPLDRRAAQPVSSR
jgi:hypothetical protein